MKFKRHRKIEYGLEQINLVPLIDVIFLLLIFFMLSTSFTFQSGIHVKLPKAVTSNTIKDENIIILVTNENIIYLNNAIVTVAELERALAKSSEQKLPILIKADRRASMGRIVDVWDLCRKLGILKINIATNKDQ